MKARFNPGRLVTGFTALAFGAALALGGCSSEVGTAQTARDKSQKYLVGEPEKNPQVVRGKFGPGKVPANPKSIKSTLLNKHAETTE
jgi:hypothetical protein